VAKKDVNQDLFITAEKSIITYGEIFEAHSSVCRGKLKTTKRTMKGHVASCFSKSSIMNRQNSRTEKRMAQPVIHQAFIIWQIW
jgi:hypothetical protein